MLHRRKLHYQTPPLCKGAHEGRAQCAKQAVAVEAPEYRTSEAQAGTKTPVKQGASQVHFAHIGGPKGWSVEHTERSVVRRHGTLGRRRRDQCVGENMPGRTRAPPKARARAKQASTVRTRRPEGLERRGHAQRASADAEHRASVSAGAHEGRALCAKQAEVSPMKQGVPQASL